MLQFLRDPLWQAVGAILALAALIASIWAIIEQRRRKRISYQLLWDHKIVDSLHLHNSKLVVLFDGREVDQVSLLIIEIKNTGNVPILPSDFIKDITISLNDDSIILGAGIAGTSCSDMDIDFVLEKDSIAINGTLLNSGDYFAIQILVQDYRHFKIGCRISGVKDIKEIAPITATPMPQALLLAVIFLIASMHFYSAGPSLYTAIGMVATGCGLIALGRILWRSQKILLRK